MAWGRRLEEIAEAAFATLSLDELLYDVLQRIQEVLAVDTSAVFLHEAPGLRIRAVTGSIPYTEPADPILVGSGFIGRVADERRPQVTSTPDALDLGGWADGANCETLMAAPLLAEGRLVGVLCLGTRARRDFSRSERDFLQRAANHAALAVDHARMYRQAQREIAARKDTEEDLRRSELRFRALFEHAPGAVLLLDPYDELVPLLIVDCNGEALQQNGYGRDELIGKPLTLLDPNAPSTEDDISELLSRMRRSGVLRDTVRHRRKDGEAIWVERAASLIRLDEQDLVLSIELDVTERRRLEEQLRQSQKMEAIGRLTGGVAHDFNNMLSVIGGYSELLLLDAPPEDPSRERIEEIHKAAKRAAELTRQLLIFSRRETPRMGPVGINEAVRDLSKMMARLIGEDVELATRLAPDVGTIRANVGQLHQVLVNLAVNARDAMPEGGKLLIETQRLEVDASVTTLCAGMPTGDYVLLTVSDTGSGMDEATRQRIFDPFFTTKAAGKGTGLGLAVVYGIVQQSGGFIHVFSEPGEGSAFQIYFPLEPMSGAERPSGPPTRVQLRGNETVLVVEDEAMLRQMLRHTLTGLGYQVLVAAEPNVALEICAQHAGSIDLLLSDLVMPQMNGRALAERARELRPELRVLLMSGYTDEIVLRGQEDSPYQFIEKPFPLNVLAGKVREVLAQPLPAGKGPRGNGRVLIVDDDQQTRDSLVELLTDEGYQTEVAADGRQALERLRAAPLPDLILLDLRMPAMNGWVFRIEQRKDPRFAEVPVIVLSGGQDPSAAAAFLDASDYLGKPIDVEELLKLVRKYTE
jgi:two-component system cell cycle sensor histidine kinase/response regulator CckA